MSHQNLKNKYGFTFNKMWQQFAAFYLWKERVEIERKYGKNPNVTSQSKEFSLLSDVTIC